MKVGKRLAEGLKGARRVDKGLIEAGERVDKRIKVGKGWKRLKKRI